MASILVAAVVPATVTVETIDTPLRRVTRRWHQASVIGGWQFGGQFAGAWSNYLPEHDPANWYDCELCAGTGRRDDERGISLRTADSSFGCNGCAPQTPDDPRPPGNALTRPWEWIGHDGDLVPLPRLLEPTWRFPAGRYPGGWVDAEALRWLDRTDDGSVGPVLADVFRSYLAGTRKPGWGDGSFDPAQWKVAVTCVYR